MLSGIVENERNKRKKKANKYIRKIKPLRTNELCNRLPDKMMAEDVLKYYDLHKKGLVDLVCHRQPFGLGRSVFYFTSNSIVPVPVFPSFEMP